MPPDVLRSNQGAFSSGMSFGDVPHGAMQQGMQYSNDPAKALNLEQGCS
jgi:hypothetical protein